MHLIYSTYNAPESVLNLPYATGFDLIKKVVEKELERSAWELWLTYDVKVKQELPFTEFLRKIKEPPQDKDTRTEEEIMQDAENTLAGLAKAMKRT